MRAVKNYDDYVKKYLKKTGRQKTLIEFEKCLERKQPKGTCCDLLTFQMTIFRKYKACKAQFCDSESSRKNQKRTRVSEDKAKKIIKERCRRKELFRHSRKIHQNCQKIWTSRRAPRVFL